MVYTVIKSEVVDEGIAVVTLDRPESLNALNRRVFEELGLAFEEIGQNKGIKAAVLTGSGSKAFAAGADLTELQHLSALEARDLPLRRSGPRSGLPRCQNRP